MNTESLKETIRRELPELLRTDPDLRAYILELTRREYAGRAETQDRFYELLAELRRDREEQSRKWEEQSRKWDEQNSKLEEQNRRWEEQNSKLEEQNRRWEEQNRRWNEQNIKWDEQNRRWEEQNSKWEEQSRRWDANQEELLRLHEEIMAQAKKHDRSIGALGYAIGTGVP